jgi:hypothetical protein
MNNKFYVYEWYNKNTNEVFYVGKGTGKRYLSKKRNKKFLEYIEKNETDVRIVKNNLLEEDAFKLEYELTEYYKEKGQCSCNLAKGGTGGVSSVWTNEFREYWSEYNPMKDPIQRERMSKNNPMKNKETAEKNGKSHRRAVVINNKYYDGVITAAKELNHSTDTIISWCKKGCNPQGEPCRYADEEQKIFTLPTKPGARPVIIDGIYYPTIREGAKAIGLNNTTSLSDALRHGRKKCKGHICEYANQQPS